MWTDFDVRVWLMSVINALLAMGVALIAGVIFLAGLFVLKLLALLKIQSRLVYNPTWIINSTPDQYGLDYEEITFESEDGTAISAWFIPKKKSRKFLLFCHGNYGNISDRRNFIELFHSLDFNIFIFDYRGYGNSRGRPSEMGTYMDAQAAWSYLTEKIGAGQEEIVILGRSLGGAVASRLAGGHTPAALVLECAFTSIADIARDIFRVFPFKFLIMYRYPTNRYIQEIKCPVLIIHSPDDTIVPFKHGKKLFELAAGEPKQFLELRGGHNEAVDISREEYRQGILQFLKTVFDD